MGRARVVAGIREVGTRAMRRCESMSCVSRHARMAVAVMIITGAVLCAMSAPRTAELERTSAAAWPTRPIRLIASVSAGTSLDALARLTALRIGSALGQQVVVENRGGAAGNIAAEAVARAAPDGYTLLFSSNSLATLPALQGARAVDPLVALAPVAMVASQPMIVVAHPSFRGTAFSDVTAAARESPGTVAYATSGVG